MMRSGIHLPSQPQQLVAGDRLSLANPLIFIFMFGRKGNKLLRWIDCCEIIHLERILHLKPASRDATDSTL